MKGAEFTDAAVIQDSNGAVRSAITTTPGAIGYVDAAYVDDSIKALSYDGVKYSIAAVVDGKYASNIPSAACLLKVNLKAL